MIMMECYNADEFIELVERASFIYGHVSLNAAVNVPARIKKKSLLENLKQAQQKNTCDGLDIHNDNVGQIYCSVEVDNVGRTIIRLV